MKAYLKVWETWVACSDTMHELLTVIYAFSNIEYEGEVPAKSLRTSSWKFHGPYHTRIQHKVASAEV